MFLKVVVARLKLFFRVMRHFLSVLFTSQPHLIVHGPRAILNKPEAFSTQFSTFFLGILLINKVPAFTQS